MIERPPLDPRVVKIAEAVFAAKQEANREQYVPDQQLRAAWAIYMGSRAFQVLRFTPGQEMIIGRRFYTGESVRERGRVDQWSVLGVPVVEDPRGPLDMWRLAEADGTTIAYGDLT